MEIINQFFSSPVKIYIFIVLIISSFFLPRKLDIKWLIIIFILIGFLTELTNTILLVHNKSIILTSIIGVFFQNTLLLVSLFKIGGFQKNTLIILLSLHFFITGIDVLFFGKLNSFNYNSFITSAIIYISCFLSISLAKLKNEQLKFFSSKEFLLAFSPIPFYFGMSFIFAFKSVVLSFEIIFNKVYLYMLINIISNFIMYTLILVHIIKDKNQQQHAS